MSGIIVLFAENDEPMPKTSIPLSAIDWQIRALLERHHCPVPFHEVRTRFLGNIATPAAAASPIRMVESLWGGALPEFPSLDAANELIGALLMVLWNRLTLHQDRKVPFRLMWRETTATREGLAALETTRRQELDGPSPPDGGCLRSHPLNPIPQATIAGAELAQSRGRVRRAG